MRLNSFARALAFAALAAIAWIPWVILAAPFLGVWNARAVYLVGTAIVYIAALTPSPKFRSSALFAVLAIAALVASHTMTELVLLLAGAGAAFRSGVVQSGRSAMVAVVTEVALLGAGLSFARLVPSTALAVWAFFLVQALYFLRGEERRPVGGDDEGAAFDTAHRRAMDLLG